MGHEPVAVCDHVPLQVGAAVGTLTQTLPPTRWRVTLAVGMEADLSGVEAKINWAKGHLAALKNAIADTLETHPYRFDGGLDAETGEYIITVHTCPKWIRRGACVWATSSTTFALRSTI
jgi:hypothetical protein